jgi:hypothetical protein
MSGIGVFFSEQTKGVVIMKTQRLWIIGSVVCFMVAGLAMPEATAQRSRGISRGGSAARTPVRRPGGGNAVRGMSQRNSRPSASRAPSRGSSSSRNAKPSGGQLLDTLSQLQGLGGNKNNPLGALGNVLGQGRSHRRSSENIQAKAYRDAAIANAVVGLVGILVDASARRQPPQPMHVVPQTVTERVLVREGHYEQYQEWIPPVYDRHTGQQNGGGYHETRTRWVPEVWQQRQTVVHASAVRTVR